MNQIEAQAADALLDRRLKINLPAPWPLRIFGQRTIPIWVKRPVASNLFRMSRLFVRMGIDPGNRLFALFMELCPHWFAISFT